MPAGRHSWPRCGELSFNNDTPPMVCAGHSAHDAEPSVTISRLDHVQLAMPAGREDEARAFYQGLLGIPGTPKPANLALRGGCWFENGSVKVHLGVDKDFAAARKAHPAFIVDDLAMLVRRLERAGHPVRDDEPLEGFDRVYVDDPFGNRIELMQPKA